MNNNSIRPDDILSDTANYIELNGLKVRKGSIAAFLKKIDRLEAPYATKIQKNEALMMLKELAPAVVSAGLHKHVTFKNPLIEDLLRSI